MNSVDLGQLSSRELLRLYADLLTELMRREVVRSRNAPVGDLAELLVARAYRGELAPRSEKSWDVRVEGRRLQVKARLVVNGARSSQVYSPFRSWDFDACVFVLLDAYTYEVRQAVELPASAVQDIAKEVAWVRGYRISTAIDLYALVGSVDRTAELAAALNHLDDPGELGL